MATSCHWRPTLGTASGVVGDTVMESCNWRDPPERQRIVNKLMDTLKRHLPFSRHDRLHELKEIADRVEEEIYTAATTQSEYSRKICFMMLTMETRLQLPKQSDSAALKNSVNPLVPLHSTAGIGNPNGGDWQQEVYQKIQALKDLYLLGDLTAHNANGVDWQEEVYRKIKAMKDLYLLDLNNMYQTILLKLQQHDSLPQQPKNGQLEKLKMAKNMLECLMQFLQLPKHGIVANYKDKLGTYEKQIIILINSYRRKPMPPQQQALLAPHVQSVQQSQQTHSQSAQVQSHDQMNLQVSTSEPSNVFTSCSSNPFIITPSSIIPTSLSPIFTPSTTLHASLTLPPFTSPSTSSSSLPFTTPSTSLPSLPLTTQTTLLPSTQIIQTTTQTNQTYQSNVSLQRASASSLTDISPGENIQGAFGFSNFSSPNTTRSVIMDQQLPGSQVVQIDKAIFESMQLEMQRMKNDIKELKNELVKQGDEFRSALVKKDNEFEAFQSKILRLFEAPEEEIKRLK